jgi:hypothetical protein
MSTVTLGGNTYTLITMPGDSGFFAAISVTMADAVAIVESPYVPAQNQTQIWPAADRWSFQIQLPKMTRATAAPWISFLAALQGFQNVFQVGDPLGRIAAGVADGAPVVTAGTGLNAVGGVSLVTRGWTPNKYRQLMPGDYIQVKLRLYQVTAQVNADASGNATISLWPSLRETPDDATPVHLVNPRGVFRLSSNKRQWHASPAQLTEIGFACSEVI